MTGVGPSPRPRVHIPRCREDRSHATSRTRDGQRPGLVSRLCGSLTLAAEPTPDEAHTPLTAVTKRPSYVFASIPGGLFRASRETRRWERLKTPPEMPPNGDFARQPEGRRCFSMSPVVRYWVTGSPAPAFATACTSRATTGRRGS